MLWTLAPFRWFMRRPRPLVIGVLTGGEAVIESARLIAGNGVTINGVLFVPLGAWLTYRQWKAKKKFPDGYPGWASSG